MPSPFYLDDYVSLVKQTSSDLPMNEVCNIAVYALSRSPKNVINTVIFEVQQVLTRVQGNNQSEVDCTLLKDVFEAEYMHQVFAVRQLLAVSAMTSRCVSSASTGTRWMGTTEISTPTPALISKAIVSFTNAKDALIRLTNQSSGSIRSVFKPVTKLEIGGQNREFNGIFRRAFASRLFLARLVQKLQKLGIQYAMPAKEPKVVNGPEILDRFVSKSERMIHELFSDARKDQEELGDESDVHIIIVDGIDAICKNRGLSSSGTLTSTLQTKDER
ncbi:unnamed protein product [Peronospora destructor]|uniref:Vesicle-fusing ATPase n=1 Tax=Peronospora destructor TaxID=86335 RepID=A0AAV0V7C4_9STRA|nr:unnamed protein product [Peronospora destructor]